MQLIADGLLISAALTATLYCLVLSRRLRSLNDAGAGIAEQIRTLDKTLADTRTALKETQSKLSDLKGSARIATEKLSREVWLAKQAIVEITGVREAAEAVLSDTDSRVQSAVPPKSNARSAEGGFSSLLEEAETLGPTAPEIAAFNPLAGQESADDEMRGEDEQPVEESSEDRKLDGKFTSSGDAGVTDELPGAGFGGDIAQAEERLLRMERVTL